MKQRSLMLCLLLALTTPLVRGGDVLSAARSFLGVPYVAGTLEGDGEERLIINTDSLDCTTFVELSVARWLTARGNNLTFGKQVEALRYRCGVVNGYLSRLHYFTDWIAENECRGVWHEVKPAEKDNRLWQCDTLSLTFMTTHPQSYPYLKANAWAIDSMRRVEARYADYPIHYIKKEYLNLPPEKLPIHNGDILALVTTIEGLDVTHLGFAVWKGNKLHLMHASMTHGKVVVDERTLYDYLQKRKSCPGVRVVRLQGTEKQLIEN